MATAEISSDFTWKCSATWRRASVNTLWCLAGCSIGDFGTILFFQLTGIGWPTLAIMSLAIVNGILHPDSRPVYYGPKRGAQLGSAMIKDVQPGEDIRALHRDDNYPLPHPHPPLIVNSLLALDPFNNETGGTWVVPRSHTWSGDVSSTTEHVTVTMDPGSIVLFNGALWHGRGPNYTPDQTRRALNLLYNCSWLRPWEGEHLGIPENEWNSLPPAVKAIL